MKPTFDELLALAHTFHALGVNRKTATNQSTTGQGRYLLQSVGIVVGRNERAFDNLAFEFAWVVVAPSDASFQRALRSALEAFHAANI